MMNLNSPLTLFLLEDEISLAETLKIALKRLKFDKIYHVSTLQEAEEVLVQFTKTPDLFILDRNLPDGDGVQFIAKIRDRDPEAFILMLTAKGKTKDRIEGLAEGADDYLAKPFSLEELTLRIENLLKRKARKNTSLNPTSQSLKWVLIPERLEVQSPSKEATQLTPLEFKLVKHLIEAKGNIVSRDELLKNVWGFTLLPKTRTVDFFMTKLRKIFEKNPEDPQHFITVRGAGYQFKE